MRVRLVRVHADREPEVGRQVPADLRPRQAAVVGPHHVPVLLHEQRVRLGRVRLDVVHAVPHLGVLVGDALRMQPAVHRPPRLAGVVGPERARRGDRGEHPRPLQDDRVQAETARARLPAGRGRLYPEAGQLGPSQAPVGRLVQRCVLPARVHRVRVVRRRLEVPDPLELPRPQRAVVPQVRARVAAGVAEVVPGRLPGRAPVVGTLDQLAEPPRVLRGVQPVRIGGGALHVVHLPPPEVRPAHRPLVALAVRSEDERTLARPRQYPYLCHRTGPFVDFWNTRSDGSLVSNRCSGAPA